MAYQIPDRIPRKTKKAYKALKVSLAFSGVRKNLYFSYYIPPKRSRMFVKNELHFLRISSKYYNTYGMRIDNKIDEKFPPIKNPFYVK